MVRKGNSIITMFWTFIGIIVGVPIAVIAVNLILPRSDTAYYNSWGMMEGFGGNSFFLGPLMMIIPIAIFFIFTYWLIIAISKSTEHYGLTTEGGNQTKTPLEILNERYAKGSITREEFLKMKDVVLKK